MKDEFRIGPLRPDKGPSPTEVEGTVSQYLLNPRGEVDGLLLDDRTVIKFPPHLARELVEVVRPKERVRANGHLEAEKLLKGHVIANPATGRAIREIKPTPPERASTLGPLQSLSVAGTIRVIRRNPQVTSTELFSRMAPSCTSHRMLAGSSPSSFGKVNCLRRSALEQLMISAKRSPSRCLAAQPTLWL